MPLGDKCLILSLERKPTESIKTESRFVMRTDGKIGGGGGKFEFVRVLFRDDAGRRVEMVAFGATYSAILLALELNTTYLVEDAHVQMSRETTRLFKHANNIAFDLSLNANTKFRKLDVVKSSSSSSTTTFKTTTSSFSDLNNNDTSFINEELQPHKPQTTNNTTNFSSPSAATATVNSTTTPSSSNYLASLPKLNELYLKESKLLVNILAIIESVDHEIKLQKINSKNLKLRNFFIIDPSGIKIRVAVWGKEAESFQFVPGNIVFFKQIQITNYNGISLSVMRVTLMTPMDSLSNTNPTVMSYSSWWQNYKKK